MKIKCIENKQHQNLTKGKEYKLQATAGQVIYVTDDTKQIRGYDASLFEKIEFRGLWWKE